MPATAKLQLDQVGMTFKTASGAFQALAPVTLSHCAGPLRQPDRPVRLRQEHDLQHRRRTAAADRRPGTDRRRRRHRHHRPRRLHAAEGFAAALAQGARQCHPRHGDPGPAAARGARTRAAAAAPLRAVRIRISRIRMRSPAACASARRFCARCCSTPTSFCSTNRSARSTPRPNCTCRNGCSAVGRFRQDGGVRHP